MNLIFIDSETTGLEKEDRLCQLAYKAKGKITNSYFKPPIKIKIEAMATHHITNEMIDEKPVFETSLEKQELEELAKKDYIFVAHNAKFDIEMLSKEGLEIKNYICTLKIARHLDKEGIIPNYSLQYLRYLLGLKSEQIITAHNAESDIIILELLFERLKEKMLKESTLPFVIEEDVYKEMMRISKEPSLIKKFPFGKYKGQKLADVFENDRGYFDWLLKEKKKEEISDEDWLYSLNHYLIKNPIF